MVYRRRSEIPDEVSKLVANHDNDFVFRSRPSPRCNPTTLWIISRIVAESAAKLETENESPINNVTAKVFMSFVSPAIHLAKQNPRDKALSVIYNDY